jgi:hypothetical protein
MIFDFIQNWKVSRNWFNSVLGALKKVRLFVCPSARVAQLGSNRMDFHEILHLSTFRKYVGEIQDLIW